MRATIALLLPLATAAAAAPISTEPSPRGLLNLSPVLDPDVKLGGDNSCTGIGISACNPINVGGEQNNDQSEETDNEVNDDTNQETDNKAVDNGSDSLINIAPDISPDLSLGGDNGCLGIGISVCDPINVDGSQGNS